MAGVKWASKGCHVTPPISLAVIRCGIYTQHNWQSLEGFRTGPWYGFTSQPAIGCMASGGGCTKIGKEHLCTVGWSEETVHGTPIWGLGDGSAGVRSHHQPDHENDLGKLL